jgi:succinate dehydrogenase flavin-adding protein (antitoxin of CptAB toxin-antitoxin module)
MPTEQAGNCADTRAGGAAVPHDRRLDRIRWRCRRGKLENDLVLARFLDRHGERLTEQDVEKLGLLLDMSDDGLWDVIAGRAEPAPALAGFVARLRAEKLD